MLQAALEEALDDSLDDLRAETDPRRAVIAAYARLERVLARPRCRRDTRPRRRTSTCDRVLSSLELSRRAVSRLTALFQTAKFSHHEVDDGMKEEAIDALVSARDELRAARERAEAERRAGARACRRTGPRVRRVLRAGVPGSHSCPTVALAIALALIPSRAELLVHVWLLVLLVLARAGRPRRAAAGLSARALAVRPPAGETQPQPGRFPSLERIEREVALAAASRTRRPLPPETDGSRSRRRSCSPPGGASTSTEALRRHASSSGRGVGARPSRS